MFEEEEQVVRGHRSRTNIISNVIIFSFLGIIIRLWYLQIYKGEEFYRYSIQNRLRREVVDAPRGMIFSRNDALLVHNTPRFDAAVIPQYLRNKDRTLNNLSRVLGIERKVIDKIIKKNQRQASYRPIVIKKNISRKEVAIIETEGLKMPGVSVQTFISREYLDGEIGGHLFGHIGEITQDQLPKYRKRDNVNYKIGDFIGLAGIEQRFDLLLRGEKGYQFMEVDARGRMRRPVRSKNIFSGIENRPAVPGKNIRLTIDRDMQIEAYKSLEGKVGSVVAIKVNTGEVLTMVSRPSFDPSKFSRGLSPEYWSGLVSNPNNPLRDRSIQEHYAPGSTFKPIAALAALEEGLITPDQVVPCGPTFRLGRRVYHDWKKNGHGPTDLYKSLKRSVDVYYYKIGSQMDIDVLARYARSFGLGVKTGITLPRETTGLIPTRDWKKKKSGKNWERGETLSCIIGQSYVLATPLQLAMVYAALANGGKIYRPYVIQEIFSNSGEAILKFTPELVSRVKVLEKNLNAVKTGLYQVVNAPLGTAWWARGEGIRMAGKTGTSQVRSMAPNELFTKCQDLPPENRHHGLFVAFAPFDWPMVAVSAIVEHGCSGSSSAAPIVRNVLQTYMKKYHPKEYDLYAKEDRKKNFEFWKAQRVRKEAQEP